METKSEGERPQAVRVLRLAQELLELPDLERALLLQMIRPNRTAEEHFKSRLEYERVRFAAAGLKLLSPKEKAVVDCYASGMGTSDIAARLGISPNTVANFRKRAMAKLGAESLVELVRLAVLAASNVPVVSGAEN